MPTPNALRSLLVCLAHAALSAPAQTPPQSPPPAAQQAVEQTPDAFMRQAADTMSLTAPDMKPWHLRAHYKTFKPDGSVLREGTFEEWWAGPQHFKTTNVGADFNRTEYRVGASSFYTGSNASDSFLGELLHPLPYPARLDEVSFLVKDHDVGDVKLKCYSETFKNPGSAAPTTAFCFDQTDQLRLSEWSTGLRTVFNQVVSINGHSIAKQITQAAGSPGQQTASLTLSVEQLDPDLQVDEAALTPPPDAKPLRRKILISSGVMQGLRIGGNEPVYPAEAKSAHVQGSVIIQTTVNEQGSVEDLRVVSGPPMLQKAALDAAKTWRYKPYLLNGDAIEVQTTINIVFKLSP